MGLQPISCVSDIFYRQKLYKTLYRLSIHDSKNIKIPRDFCLIFCTILHGKVFRNFIVVKIWSAWRERDMPKTGSNIRKRADGRWEGRYKYLTPEKVFKMRSVYGKTCGEVKEKMERLVIEQAAFRPLGKWPGNGWPPWKRRGNIPPV